MVISDPNVVIEGVESSAPDLVNELRQIGANVEVVDIDDVNKAVIEDLENLGKEHQIVKPNLITGMTAFGELTKAGSQVEMSKAPQSWDAPLLHVPSSCKPEWVTKS